MNLLRPRQSLGKYRIERKLAEGGFGIVYRALDTIEGVRVALKVPYPHLVDRDTLSAFRQEARLAARLDHPNILPLKYADFMEGHFVMVTMLGDGTLEERLRHRMSLRTALAFADQMLDAVSHAHRMKIIHCDIKPDNLLLFGSDRLRLTDFGIARVAHRTIEASGSGTVGYVAPEQAMGRPSARSDVFSLGLVLYRMLAGALPEWPFAWPPPRYDRIRRLHPDLGALLRRALEVDPRKRFADAAKMLGAFRRIRPRALRHATIQGRRRRPTSTGTDWEGVRQRQFRRQFGKALETRHGCARCAGPVSEAMQACPWCGVSRPKHAGSTSFPAQCPRCQRGLKADWNSCPWCHGPGFEPRTTRQYGDRRYSARCSAPGCTRRHLMPFMRYCPWCRRKVRKKWAVQGSTDRCSSCGWGVVRAFWSHCPWCGKSLQKK